ncbi:MAG: endoglucanase [Caulobacter sp.]|nr:endoglucanase [Caulobacter sp.]
MNLRALLRSGVAAICIAAVAAPPSLAARAPAHKAAPAGAQLAIKVGEAPDFTRVEFHWTRAAAMTVRRDGQVVTLAFSREARPDLSDLRITPPRWVKAAEARHGRGGLEVVITLADDAEFSAGRADDADFINIFARPPVAAAAPVATPAERRPDPMPASRVVPVGIEHSASQAALSFTWAAPAGAAVFRRGEAVWIVFDTPARLDIGKLPPTLKQYRSLRAFQGADYTALRIVTLPGQPYSAQGDGSRWTVTLGSAPTVAPEPIKVARDETASPAALTAVLNGATKPVWVPDAAVGDRLAVAPALAPSKGLSSRREYVEMALLPSAQGLAVESYASDIQIAAEGDLIRIGRPKGLVLSPLAAETPPEEAVAGAPQPASMPALIDMDSWPRTGSGGFLARYNALLTAVSDAGAATDKDAETQARMALARFLVGSNLSFEAIGVLNAAARRQQSLVADPEFRGLRGVARVMAGRYAEAETDFASPVLADEPSAALWRGYMATKAGRWADAQSRFTEGGRALSLFPVVWQARFLGAQAEAALGSSDTGAAGRLIDQALKLPSVPVEDQLGLRLTQAKVFEAKGEKIRALRMFQAITRAPIDRLAAPAELHAIQLSLAKGEITANQAADRLDHLRFRWRGDGTELDTIRGLAQLYVSQGRYRKALEVLRSAGARLPDLPQAVALRNDLYGAFRALFLDGLADGLQPIQAVGLFYDYQELTPIGADGDQMVRNLVRRLVDVDLLDDAAKLLKYQVDNRLDGVAKAQVATDLAWIYLMNRQPESALDAINGTRTTLLPPALNAERRLATARALMGLGRYDAALELIETDTSRDALDIRAEVAWKQHNWAMAGALYEKSLAERWKRPGALAADDETRLMRAGIAFSLADDDPALGRLRQRFGGFVDGGRNPEGLRVALAGANAETVTSGDFSRVTADNEVFGGWVAKMKDRFRTAAPTPAVAPGRQVLGSAAPGKA